MRSSFHVLTSLAIAALVAASGAARASEPGAVRMASLPESVLGAGGVPTLAPFAHVVFCKSQPQECRSTGPGASSVDWTPGLEKTIQAVNRRVNRTIRPVAETGGPLGDVWRIAPAAGDCDDYAVTKRHELLAAGLPASALRLMVVLTPSGEGHAVLAVRTSRGDMILDNLTPRILEWRNTGLTLVKYQSGANPERWLRPSGSAVASVEQELGG